MKRREPMLPEYGGGGDLSGALRRRRAFRLLVLGWLAFTVGLYLTDRYLRNEHTENLYRDSLTMAPGSGRVLLRNAIGVFEKRGEVPPVKFLHALAEREEDDLKLGVYVRAYEIERERLEVQNPEFLIRYGVQLFIDGKYLEARERFRDASLMAKSNALPIYLEAAAIAASAQTNDDYGRAVAAMVSANATAPEFVLPRVLWSQELPRESKAYADLRRRIADECSAPLYRLTEIIAGRVDRVAEEQGKEQAEVWMAALDAMGARMLSSPEPPTSLAVTGLHIRNEAVRKRIELAGKYGATPDEKLIHERITLENALGALRSFDAERMAWLEGNLLRVQAPLWTAMSTVGGLFALYAAAAFVMFLFGPPHDPWALGFGSIERTALWTGTVAFAAALALLTLGIRASGEVNLWLDALVGLWRLALALTLVAGLAGPFITLPRVVSDAGDERAGLEAHRAKNERRIAALVHDRRFLGRLLGCAIIVSCMWFLAFRVATGAYPHHAELVASGRGAEEARTVSGILTDVANVW